MKKLLLEISTCNTCSNFLPYPPRPVLYGSEKCKIIIIGQAPGRKVHESNIGWNDKSGDTLRMWLGVEKKDFYNPDIFASLPMGFCYPGTGKTGDFPPRKECAPQWHDSLLKKMPNRKLILLIGAYAQKYYLQKQRKKNLTETVRNFEEYLPEYFTLVHPSPLNFRWQGKNPWFKTDVLPKLYDTVQEILKKDED